MTAPRFDVITLFPQQFEAMLGIGVVGRALAKGLFSLRCWNPRDYTTDVHRTVDDRPYGGGPGMVMLAEPLLKTLQAIRADRQTADPADNAPLVYLTPHGPRLQQAHVRQHVAQQPHGLIALCGRYEGVDQRFIDAHVNLTYCLGDFVLSGGELPVACLLDAWVRLLPGALNHTESAAQDSFEGEGLLDCPHYTRPEVLNGVAVPDVLLSGNHAKISDWRFEQSIEMTKRHRPDLFEAYASSNAGKASSSKRKK